MAEGGSRVGQKKKQKNRPAVRHPQLCERLKGQRCRENERAQKQDEGTETGCLPAPHMENLKNTITHN